MAKYVTYTVEIPIQAEGELEKRLEVVAARNHCTVQSVVDTVVQLGIYGHIQGNLALLEQSPGR